MGSRTRTAYPAPVRAEVQRAADEVYALGDAAQPVARFRFRVDRRPGAVVGHFDVEMVHLSQRGTADRQTSFMDTVLVSNIPSRVQVPLLDDLGRCRRCQVSGGYRRQRVDQ